MLIIDRTRGNDKKSAQISYWGYPTLSTHKSCRPLLNYRPTHVIIDVSWADYFQQGTNWFFQKFPVKSIIEVFTSIPTDMDCGELLWNEVEARLTEEELQSQDIMVVDIIFENLIAYFYEQLHDIMPNISDQYVFLKWLDPSTMILMREDLWYRQRDNLLQMSSNTVV